MAVIHTQFGLMAIYAVIGGLFRHVMGLRSDQIQVITRTMTIVTLPCLAFKTFYSIDSWPPDAAVFFISFIVVFLIHFVIAFVVFRDYNDISPQLILSTVHYNIGVFFYPIMTEIAGVKGTQKLALFDLLNGFSLCVASPFILYFLLNRSKKNEEENRIYSKENKKSEESKESKESDESKESKENESIEMEETNQRNDSKAELFVSDQKDAILHSEKTEQIALSPFAQPIFGYEGEGFVKRFHSFLRFLNPVLHKLLLSPSFVCSVLGLILGISHVSLFSFLSQLIDVGAKANTFVSFFSIGILFEFRIPLRYLKPSLYSLLIRYILGFSIGMTFYFVIPYVDARQVIDEYSRVALLIVFIMPPAIMTSVWCVEFGLDTALTTLILNIGTVLSFIVMLVELSIIDIPHEASSVDM